MTLRVVAVSAPEYSEGRLGKHMLTSEDPASLYNACRVAAKLASSGIGFWGDSNWVGSRADRRKNVLLMHSLKEEMAAFESLLRQERPNLLLIGAMTLCLPGAIACAQRAREILGDDVFIVLGGRHASETIYKSSGGHRVEHHPGSPLRLAAEGIIDPVFNLVISGEGEHVIAALGEIVGRASSYRMRAVEAVKFIEDIRNASGDWLAGWVEEGRIEILPSAGSPLDHDTLPPPCEMFGVHASFDVFGGRLTAHVFSDSGGGCTFDCDFCSERRTVAGTPSQIRTSAPRLFEQLRSAVRVIGNDSPGFKASAFVEDSTLLSGSNAALSTLANLLSDSSLDIRFGAQMTVDQILAKTSLLRRLKQVGLDYMFIGIETLNPSDIGGMSKDVRTGKELWVRRTDKVLETLWNLGITTGTALLFGLGESRDSRLELFENLASWRTRFGCPEPVSLNWAVQHPLRGNDGGTGYRYVEWGTPTGDFLDAFLDFGEASLLYPIAGQKAPSIEEVHEVKSAFAALP